MTLSPAITRRARDFYATYCASSDGKNFQGNPCPDWDALPEAIRGHWYTVALRSLQLVDEGTTTANLGREHDAPPSGYVVDHLPDPIGAVEVWRRYSGIAAEP